MNVCFKSYTNVSEGLMNPLNIG